MRTQREIPVSLRAGFLTAALMAGLFLAGGRACAIVYGETGCTDKSLPNAGDPFTPVDITGVTSMCAGSCQQFEGTGGGDCDLVSWSVSCTGGQHGAANAYNSDVNYSWSISATGVINSTWGTLTEYCRVEASHDDFTAFTLTASRTEVPAPPGVAEGGTHSKNKTVVVSPPDYALATVCAHDFAGETTADVETKMMAGTQDVLLKDDDGIELTDDVHCCKGLQVDGSVTTFSDEDVGPGATYENVDSRAKYNDITGAWVHEGTRKQLVVVTTFTWDPLEEEVGPDRAWTIGSHVYISTAQDGWTWIHEWGHLGGGLPDKYDVNTGVPFPGYEHNFMGVFDGTHVRADQCSALP